MEEVMKKIFTYLILILASFSIVACSTTPARDVGVATGAVAGGVVGAAVSGGRAVATGVGAVAGAVVGGVIGQSMDDQDRARTMYAMGHNPVNQSMRWVNPRTGMTYIVVPGRYVTVNGNPHCRKY